MRDSTGHQQPHLPADAGDGGQPAQVSETFPQEQHQEGPSVKSRDQREGGEHRAV